MTDHGDREDSPAAPLEEGRRGLEALGEPPPPRRSDAAFARAVAAGLRERRGRLLFAVPALAMATAALALVLLPEGGNRLDIAPDAGLLAAAAPAEPPVDAPAELADAEDDVASIGELFAIPSLEGSSDEELARLDRALDDALARRARGG
jgi:hypothetical protein